MEAKGEIGGEAGQTTVSVWQEWYWSSTLFGRTFKRKNPAGDSRNRKIMASERKDGPRISRISRMKLGREA
jgi:hypothetical protein